MSKLDKRAISILVISLFLLSAIPFMSVSAVDPIEIDIDHPALDTEYQVGAKIFVEGINVISGATVNLYWDYVNDAGFMNNTLGKPGSTFKVSMKVPDTVVGDHWVWVKDMGSGFSDSRRVVVIPKVKTSASSGLENDEITVTGTGFAKASEIGLYFGTGASTPNSDSFTGDGTDKTFTLTKLPVDTITSVSVGLPIPITVEAVGTGTGAQTVFNLANFPVVPGSETIYLDSIPQPDDASVYTLVDATGVITFLTAPAIGVDITADYDYIASVVAEPVGTTTVTGTFTGSLLKTPIVAGTVSLTIGAETFTDNGLGVLTGSILGTGTIVYASGALTVTGAPLTIAITADYDYYVPKTPESVGTGDGTTTIFPPLAYIPVVPGSETIYLDGVPSVITYNLVDATGVITFATAPAAAVAITADYDYYDPKTTADYKVNYVTGVLTFDTAPGLGAPIVIVYNYMSHPLDVTRGTPKTNDVGTVSTTFIVPVEGSGSLVTAYDGKGNDASKAFTIGAQKE